MKQDEVDPFCHAELGIKPGFPAHYSSIWHLLSTKQTGAGLGACTVVTRSIAQSTCYLSQLA